MLFSPLLRVPANGAGVPVGTGGERRRGPAKRPEEGKGASPAAAAVVEVWLEVDDGMADTAKELAEKLESVQAAAAYSSQSRLRLCLRPTKGVPLRAVINSVVEELGKSGVTARRAEGSHPRHAAKVKRRC